MVLCRDTPKSIIDTAIRAIDMIHAAVLHSTRRSVTYEKSQLQLLASTKKRETYCW
jgi:hypothetical protein